MLKPIKKLLERNALKIAILLALIITFLSLVSVKGVNPIRVENSDKLGHLIAYFVLSLSWFFANKGRFKWPLVATLLILYGIILEVLQEILTTHRQADLYDILANSTGVILAAILYKWIRSN